MGNNTSLFIQLVNHPLKFRMFLLTRLPAAFFSGVRVCEIDEKHCVTSVPFKWLTQNPFKSTYFASLSMAAEMSTGVLGLMHVYKRTPSLSILVVKIEGNFYKKAIGRTIFVCEDGDKISQTIEEALMTGEGKVVTAKSVGKNDAGEVVAEFYVTWSFKKKA
ncbi:MAG TPA: thioesterase [Chitinophagaceae bacterium]|nr:thioesterase [Chitinophagaceae bacterium]